MKRFLIFCLCNLIGLQIYASHTAIIPPNKTFSGDNLNKIKTIANQANHERERIKQHFAQKFIDRPSTRR